MEDAHKVKAQMLESMNKLVKGLLDKNKDSVGVQVDDGELLWLPQHFLGVHNLLREIEAAGCITIRESRAGSSI